MPYEHHGNLYVDNNLRIIYHIDTLCGNEKAYVHWHKNIEILLVISGTLTVVCDGIENTFKENDIAVINKYQLHEILTSADKCSYHCLIIGSDIYGNSFSELPNKSTNPAVIDIYKRILDELNDRPSNFKEAIEGYCKVLLSIISREKNIIIQEKIPVKKIELVKKTADFIYENFAKELTLDDICEYMNISKSYLCHIFKEVTGNTINNFLNIVRCTHAKAILKSGECNVAESAYRSGYQNLSYFSKTYKKIFSHSPIDDLKNDNNTTQTP